MIKKCRGKGLTGKKQLVGDNQRASGKTGTIAQSSRPGVTTSVPGDGGGIGRKTHQNKSKGKKPRARRGGGGLGGGGGG